MNAFDVWGQIQEISPTRFLVIATACPVASGRQLSLSEVVSSPEEARDCLTRLMQTLEGDVAAEGGHVAGVLRLPGHIARRASGGHAQR